MAWSCYRKVQARTTCPRLPELHALTSQRKDGLGKQLPPSSCATRWDVSSSDVDRPRAQVGGRQGAVCTACHLTWTRPGAMHGLTTGGKDTGFPSHHAEDSHQASRVTARRTAACHRPGTHAPVSVRLTSRRGLRKPLEFQGACRLAASAPSLAGGPVSGRSAASLLWALKLASGGRRRAQLPELPFLTCRSHWPLRGTDRVACKL